MFVFEVFMSNMKVLFVRTNRKTIFPSVRKTDLIELSWARGKERPPHVLREDRLSFLHGYCSYTVILIVYILLLKRKSIIETESPHSSSLLKRSYFLEPS